jgi:hypothetical protein
LLEWLAFSSRGLDTKCLAVCLCALPRVLTAGLVLPLASPIVGCLANRSPFEGVRLESVFCRLVTEAPAASHEVGRASECYMHRRCEAVGLLRSRPGLAVSS